MEPVLPNAPERPPGSRVWRILRRLLFTFACLVTLVALFYAEEDWRGKHAWQSYREEWEAKGEKFDLSGMVPPPVPDSENFALIPLFKPLFDFDRQHGVVWHDTNGMARLDRISVDLRSGRNRPSGISVGDVEKGTFANITNWAAFYRGNTNYPQAGAAATPAETVLTALGKFDPVLQELRDAAGARPLCRFPIHYEDEPAASILLPHLAHLKGLVILTQVRATAELEAGHAADAFEDLKLGFRLADSITNENFLIDHLVRIACLSIDLQTVREGLRRHAWTEPQLAELKTYLSAVNVLAEYEFAMRGERSWGDANLDYMRRQGFRSGYLNYISDAEGTSGTPPPLNIMPGGWFYQNMLSIARLHEQFILPAVDEGTHRVFPDVSENGSRTVRNMSRSPFNILAILLFPALDKAMLRFARSQASVDLARVACALEQYRLKNGKLPEALDALAPQFIAAIPNDVMDGKPLRYRVEPDGGYFVYSVGWNQTDDGGKIDDSKIVLPRSEERNPRPDITKGDWVWTMTE